MNKQHKMTNPIWKALLIIIIIALLVIFVAPEVFDIVKDNINETSDRADRS